MRLYSFFFILMVVVVVVVALSRGVFRRIHRRKGVLLSVLMPFSQTLLGHHTIGLKQQQQ